MQQPSQPSREKFYLQQIGRAVRMVWQITPGWTLINGVMVLVQGALPLAALYVMKRIVDVVASGLMSHHVEQALRPLIVWVSLAAGVAVLTALCRTLSELSAEAQSQLMTDAVSDLLHQQSVQVDLAFYEDPRYYNSLHRAQQDAVTRPVSIVNNLVAIGQNAVSLAGIAGLLLAYNWRLALLLLLVALPGAFLRLLFARRLHRLQEQQTEDERMSWYYHWLLTDGHPAKEMRLFELGEFFRGRYREVRQRLRESKWVLSRRRGVADLLAQLLATLAIFITLGLTAISAMRGAISLGAMVIYFQGFQSGFAYLQALLRGCSGLYENSLFLNSYSQFMELQPAVVAQPPVREVPGVVQEGLRVTQASFRYPGSDHDALQAIDLTVAPGQVIALVGANGSGKTTLVKLLCRLYDPHAGAITLDGIDLRHLEPRQWRQQLSVVFQDYLRYLLTVAENIAVGDTARAPGREEIVRAARDAGIDDTISRLPKGYDTWLGHAFGQGSELSIGEWQKVAMARAFLRDAQFIILDEPSSALDPLAEAELFQRFRELIQQRSAIIISHRFSTVQMADCIYVMDDGRIVERGSHHELLQQDGIYARLYRAQAEYYQEVPAGFWD